MIEVANKGQLESTREPNLGQLIDHLHEVRQQTKCIGAYISGIVEKMVGPIDVDKTKDVGPPGSPGMYSIGHSMLAEIEQYLSEIEMEIGRL